MAFNSKEQEIITFGVQSGKTRQEVETALFNYRNNITPAPATEKKSGFFDRLKGELGASFSGLQETTERGAELMQEGKPVQGAIMSGLGAAGGFIRGVFSPVTAAVSPLVESTLKESGITDNETVQNTIRGVSKWAEENPDAAKNTQNIVEVVGALVGARGVTSAAPKVVSVVGGGAQIAKETIDTAVDTAKGAVLGATKDTPEVIMNRVARLKPTDYIKFEQRFKQTPGKYLAESGNFASPEEVISNEAVKFAKTLDDIDSTMAKLPGTYKNGAIKDALTDLLQKAKVESSKSVPSPYLKEVKELVAKYNKDGLSMEDINKAKRLFEKKVKLGYRGVGAQINAEAVQRATNIDSALRNWQLAKAKELGFENLDVLNEQVSKSKFIVDKLGDQVSGQSGLNGINLTDWIILANGNPQAVLGFLTKKTLSSKGIQAGIAKWINKGGVKPAPSASYTPTRATQATQRKVGTGQQKPSLNSTKKSVQKQGNKK